MCYTEDMGKTYERNTVVTRIAFAGKFQSEPGWEEDAYGEAWHVFVHVLDGGAECITEDGARFVARPGDLIYKPKGTCLNQKSLPGGGFVRTAVGFSLRDDDALCMVPRRSSPVNGGKMRSIFAQLVSAWAHQQPHYSVKCMQLLYEFIYTAQGENLRAHRKLRAKLQPAIAYLEGHYTGDLQLGDLAALCGLSPAYFRRLFREAYGESVVEYRSRLRIRRACDLLLGGCTKIAYVAQQAGYEDPAYFSRSFRHAMGVSPSQYLEDSQHGEKTEEPLPRYFFQEEQRMARNPDHIARFMPTDELVINPHMGFTTHNRFNGDPTYDMRICGGRGYAEGTPLEDLPTPQSLKTSRYPDTTLAYYRVYWRYFEPEEGAFDFGMFDRALKLAQSRGQTLMIRLAHHGRTAEYDIPDWLSRKLNLQKRGEGDKLSPGDPRFYEAYIHAIQALANRYDGDSRLESVDMAITGAWGEGEGIEHLPDEILRDVVDAYTQGFQNTPLMGLIVSPKAVKYANLSRPVGFRLDCLGDMGGWPGSDFSHMLDFYPRQIEQMGDVWKRAPVGFQAGWTMQRWLDMGWDADYIIEQALKWHGSTFNPKSSPIPDCWMPCLEWWLKRMGYRFAPRKVTYPADLRGGERMLVELWVENRGVAPIYHAYPLKFRLLGENNAYVLETDADICSWLPGDNFWKGTLLVPENAMPGYYRLELAITERSSDKPVLRLPVRGTFNEGWLEVGRVCIQG